MGPDSNESFNQETLEGFQTFVDHTDPASHFMRTVYVMRLHIHCKLCLTEGEREREREREREKGKMQKINS